MLLDTAKRKWKPENGTVSMWDLIMASLQDKLLTGLIYILSPVVKVMSKIQSAASVIQSQARVIISLRRIQQIKPVQWLNTGSAGQYLTYNGYNPTWTNTGQYNTAVGYQAGYHNVGTGITTAKVVPNNNFTFQTPAKTVLTITGDGDVVWSGKPSEAADILVTSFQFAVEDKKGITKAARRRYYLKACQNILNKAEKMEHEEFLDFLKKQVYNKERKVIMDALKGEH